MIDTCKYCGTQKRTCDECGAPVISRTIVEKLPDRPYTAVATLVLCSNIACKDYGRFLHEHGEFMRTIVCAQSACQLSDREAQAALKLSALLTDKAELDAKS